MGKRFSESAAKKAEGLARKRQQANAKQRAEREKLEAEEAAKWDTGSRKPNEKKALEEQKKQEKLAAKKEREAILAAEEDDIVNESRSKRR